MAVDKVLTSLHGRVFGLSSSKGLLVEELGSTGYATALMKSTADVVKNSTSLTFQPLKELTVPASVLASSTMVNYGTNTLSSGTATAVTYQIGNPAANQLVEIISRASASEITIGGTSTSILFTNGATMFLSQAAGGIGAYMVLRGESSARYAILSKSTDWVVT